MMYYALKHNYIEFRCLNIKYLNTFIRPKIISKIEEWPLQEILSCDTNDLIVFHKSNTGKKSFDKFMFFYKNSE